LFNADDGPNEETCGLEAKRSEVRVEDEPTIIGVWKQLIDI
jgi:hypothetical protein